MPCLFKQRVCFVRQICVMKCQTCTWFVLGFKTDICIGQTEASIIGQTNLDKTGFVIHSWKGKGVWGDIYLFETCKNSVFVFSSKTIQPICLTKQGLRVIIQSLCIFQTEAHSCKERHLSSPNRAPVSTKQGICICLILLFVFFMWLCLNPAKN